ncbi:TetR/AcrR family transcriptional regulator [Antrihabitans cavernicola]|uniref:TetR/AcrR family transcriptional regulator n=1 Tax=Antrihabitans cavernicola TaxID=2495913 RepID=A0A5A7SFQ3_9NOCA|nr:TetR/AcrR family transcriptional regulator [Spelaeibacter cavernicola]KAA0023463.1 TetR/AcrR family transcriptional regulator [Spelaeibacter cavernicola]
MSRTDKRRSMLDGGLAVFARDGYSRASIDTIAGESGVSTRTIYNHFEDKAGLFRAVILESANQAAEHQMAIIDRHLRKVVDLEADLVEFGRAWATPDPDAAVHFALVRQINADSGHLPKDAIDGWQETGPMRVRRYLADRIAELIERGLLSGDDPFRMALHLSLLVTVRNPSFHGAEHTAAETEAMVRAGVHAFLHGYGD